MPSVSMLSSSRCRPSNGRKDTGVRVRDYPVTLDKLLDQLPEM